jgi:3-isopropylmalate dehydrogenase
LEQILKAVAKERPAIEFNFQEHLLGGVSRHRHAENPTQLNVLLQASIDATGVPLTDEALHAAVSADAVILGAIGGPVDLEPGASPNQF